MTPERIAELRAIRANGTPGTWVNCGAQRGSCVCGLVWSKDLDLVLMAPSMDDDMPRAPRPAADAALVVAAVNELDALLDAAEERDALQRKLRVAEAEVERLRLLGKKEP